MIIIRPDLIQEGKGSQLPIGILFWFFMLLWLFGGFYWHREDFNAGRYGIFGGNLLLFIIIGLLGWRVFGPILQ